MSAITTDRLRRLARWPYAGLIVVVFGLAVAPISDHIGAPSDKANHFIAFYTLALAGALVFPRAPLWRIAVLLSAFGGLIELVQGLDAVGRDADVMDWVVDTLAIACAFMPLALSGLRRPGAADKPRP